MTNTTTPARSKRKVRKQTKKVTILFHLFVLKNALIIPKTAPPRQQSPEQKIHVKSHVPLRRFRRLSLPREGEATKLDSRLKLRL